MSTATPSRLTSLALQCYASVSAEQVATFRADPDTLTAFLAASGAPRISLGIYWHAVPFLMTGLAAELEEPYGFFLKGGDTIGRTAGGDVRYLAPRQVAAFARALSEEEPDELGMGGFDEARLDRHRIYPEFWERTSDADHLGTMRELYSYVRDLVRTARRTKLGLVIYFETETYDDGESATGPTLPSPSVQPGPPAHDGEVVFRGEDGRVYFKADASRHPSGKPGTLAAIERAMAGAGMRHVGDMITPDDPADVLRAFVSDDGTVGAILYLSAHGVGGYRFYSRLPAALVASSNTLILQMARFGFFADFLQDASPVALRDAVVTRRKKLAKKHGAPSLLAHSLAAVAALWEEQHVRCRRGL